MISNQSICNVYIVTDTNYTDIVLNELRNAGITEVFAETGRSLLLKQREGIAKVLSSTQALAEDQVQVFTIQVPEESEKAFVSQMSQKIGLPARGSIYTKKSTIVKTSAAQRLNNPAIAGESIKPVLAELVGITCIVQKGEGNPVGTIGLSTGSSVPTITYGTGTGLRNRLGLWRIMIPAEKEVVSIVCDASDTDTVLDMMITVGQIDQPGKGFIYTFPLSMGILNTKFHEGVESQAASIEQMISAIDELKGSTEWRRKSLENSVGNVKTRPYLTNLVNYEMICNEGQGETLTKIAMQAGASGATIRRLKYISLDSRESALSPAREVSVMTISEKQINGITEALETAGLFSDENAGEIYVSPVLKACTYLGKKS